MGKEFIVLFSRSGGEIEEEKRMTGRRERFTR